MFIMISIFLVRAREEFMHQMQMNLNEQSGSDDRAWILVDSDGEEVILSFLKIV